jgi:hypothetical protein
MRRAAKVDENQREIVATLEVHGFTVKSLAAVGDGVPDLLFAQHGENYLAEVKNGKRSPSKRRLTPDQNVFHEKWRGNIHIFESVDDVLLAIDKIKRKLGTKGN